MQLELLLYNIISKYIKKENCSSWIKMQFLTENQKNINMNVHCVHSVYLRTLFIMYSIYIIINVFVL